MKLLKSDYRMLTIWMLYSPSQIDHRMRPNFSVRASIEWCLLYSEVSESILHRKLRLRHDNAFMGRLNTTTMIINTKSNQFGVICTCYVFHFPFNRPTLCSQGRIVHSLYAQCSRTAEPDQQPPLAAQRCSLHARTKKCAGF